MTSLTILQARLKLQKRHFLEWDTLAAQQRTVLDLIRTKYANGLPALEPDKRAFIMAQNYKTKHLQKLISRQQDERQQLLTRQRQENACLANVVGLSKNEPLVGDLS